jgi:hypothetical protein
VGQKAALKLGLQDGFDWGEVRDAGKSGVIGDAFGMALSVVGAAGSIVAKVGGSAAKIAAKGAVKVAAKAAGAGLRGVGTVLKKMGLEAAISNFVHGTMKDTILHDPLTRLGRKMGLKVCFAAGTPLRTPTGSQLIETFQVGDLILRRDEHDAQGVITSQQVEEVFERQGLVWNLHVGGQVLRTTAEHPFYVLGQGWTACHELQAGQQLLCEDGSTITVEALVDSGEWETVYNLTVSESHTYFVGCSDWGFAVWAHNAADYDVYDQHGGGHSVRFRETPGSPTKWATDADGSVTRFATKAEADAWVASHQAQANSGKVGTLKRDAGLVLNEEIDGGVPKDYEGHHLISLHLAEDSKAMQRAADLGYNINHGPNGMALPATLAESQKSGLPYHGGRHLSARHAGAADAFVKQKLDALDIRVQAGQISDLDLLREVSKIEDATREALSSNKLRLQSNDPHWKP